MQKWINKNGKKVTSDNFIVTSFRKNKEKVNGTIAYATDFASDTNRSEILFSDEIIVHVSSKVKSVFDIIRNRREVINYAIK